MSKISLTNLVNLQNETTAVNAINGNNATLTTALDNTLSRDGTSPNQMTSTLDMNSNRIINLPFPSTGIEPLRYGDIAALLNGTSTITVPADRWGLATGTSDAITVTYAPAVTTLTDGLILGFRASGNNTTTTPTFSPNGLTAHVITKTGGTVVAIGDIKTNSEISIRYNLSNTRWEIVNAIVPPVITSNISSYATATEIASTTIANAIVGFRTLGYTAAGDGGAATYKRVSGSTIGGLQSLDGAFWQITDKVLRPEMFSSTADTVAIQLAIDAANTLGIAGEVRLSNRNYRASAQVSNGTRCLHLYGNVSLIGESPGVKDGVAAGTGSIISWGNNILNSVDIISWTGNSNNARISGIQFMPDGFTATTAVLPGTLYGQHVINVNAGASAVIATAIISDNLIGPSNGNSIMFSNAVSDFSNGTVIRNFCWSGITALALLDNCLFRDNSFNGSNVAMDITQVPGAGNLIIEHNNGICSGGAVIIRNGFAPKIINNYFEVANTFTGFNGYVYNISGSIGTITNCDFKNNIASQLSDYGVIGLVFFDNTLYADIDNTIMLNSGAVPISGIVISANNTKPYCGKALSQGNITPTGVTRQGYSIASPATVQPIGYDVPLTLLNGWVPVGNYEVPSVRRTRDGMCHINGSIQSGTVTAGTLIFTLPVGYRPNKQVFRVMPANTSVVTAQIVTTGDFTWFGTGASTSVTGVSCSYATGTE